MEKPDVDSIEGLSPAISIEQKSVSQEPALDGRHGDRDPRLPAAALRLGRPSALSQVRPGDPPADGAADGRPGAGAAAGSRLVLYAPYVRGKKGEYTQAAGADGPRGLRPGPHRRRAGRAARRAAAAGQAEEAHHRHRRRPAGGQGGDRGPARRLAGDGAQGGRRAGGAGHRRRRGDPVAELRLRRVRHLAGRDHAAAVLVQQPLRRLPRLLRPGHPQRRRRGAGDRRPRALDLGRRHRPLADRLEIVAHADGPHPGRRARLFARDPLAQAARGGAAGHPVRQRQAGDDLRAQGQAVELHLARQLRGHRAAARAALPRHRLGERAQRDREVHVGPHLPDLRRPAAAARGAGGDRGGGGDRPALGADRERARSVLRRSGARSPRAGDRRQGGAGDPRPAGLSRRRRRRLPHPRPRLGDPVGRREPADPPGDPDRQQADGRALRARRAVDRAAPARQRAADRHAEGDARPGQLGARGGARRGDHPGRRLGARPRARRRHPRRRAGVGRHPGRDRGRPRLAHRPVPARRPAGGAAGPPAAAGRAPADRPRRRPQQPQGAGRPLPARPVHRRHRRLGLGQVEPGQRHPLPRPGASLLPRRRPGRRATRASTGWSTSTR